MNAFWKRHLSWNCRFGRIDFLISIIVFWLGVIFLRDLFGESYASWPVIGKIVFYLLLAYLVLVASKRCRDLDIEPWIAPLMVILFPCMIYLQLGKGTLGNNKYGPVPQPKKE